jgi:hypothetical protein
MSNIGQAQDCETSEAFRFTRITKKKYVLAAIMGAVLLSGLALAVAPRKIPSIDTVGYVYMVEGRLDLAAVPQRYRVVVPFLAHLLPLPPLSALRLITWASLLLVYLTCFAECSLLNIGVASATISVLAMFCSRPNLCNYFNPFLTDGPGLLILFVLSVLFLSDRFGAFAALLVVGVFVRESAVFVLPAWGLTARWRRALFLGLLVTGLFMAPRIAFPSHHHYGMFLADGLRSKLSLQWLLPFAMALVLSWQGIWLLAGYGLLHSSRRFRLLAAAFGLGCFASILQASCDWERMLAILAPVLVPSAAVAIEHAMRVNRWAVALFVATLPLQFLFGNNYVLQSLAPQYHRMLLTLMVTLSVVASALVVWEAMRWMAGKHPDSLLWRRVSGAPHASKQ